MVLSDLGRRINAAVSDLSRAPTLDEKVTPPPDLGFLHIPKLILSGV